MGSLGRFHFQVPVFVKSTVSCSTCGQGGPSDSSQAYSSPSASFSTAKPSSSKPGLLAWVGVALGVLWAPLEFQRFSLLHRGRRHGGRQGSGDVVESRNLICRQEKRLQSLRGRIFPSAAVFVLFN